MIRITIKKGGEFHTTTDYDLTGPRSELELKTMLNRIKNLIEDCDDLGMAIEIRMIRVQKSIPTAERKSNG